MKRKQTLIFTLLFILPLLIYAQEEGFFTRNIKAGGQKESWIECWRANNQSPNPELDTVVYYQPQSNPFYIHWWNGGEPPIDYGWDSTFIGWLVEQGDTLFSDYTPWTSYDPEVCDTFDLILQYETTRPTIPPR